MSFLKKFLKLIPSSFVKNKDSNNWKLAKFYTSRLDEINETFDNIELYRNVENAKGKLLDNLGDKYGVKRGPADDSFYRMMIKSKIANRKGDTTVNGVLRTMQNALDIDVKGVKLGPVYQKDGKQEPLALRLTNVPLRFARSEYEQEFMLHQIESIIAAGVRLQDLQFIVPLAAHWTVSSGLATVDTFTIDDSKDYTFNHKANFGLGATSGYTDMSAFDDSKYYSNELAAHYGIGITEGTTEMTMIDDSKQYANQINGHFSPAISINGVATVEITDQFDSKFEIRSHDKAGAAMDHREEYNIK